MALQVKSKINPNVILLGLVSFLNDLSSEMILPILPMFIISLGGGGIAVGLIGGFREGIASILKVFSGYVSDRSGRRKELVFWGYLSSAVFKILLALSRIWQQVFIFTGLERIGKGLRTAPRDAIIAELSPDTQRGINFGIHRMFDTLGAALGALVTLLLFWFLRFNFRAIIFIAAIISFFSILPIFLVKAKKIQPKKISFSLSIRSLPRPLKIFIFISTVFYLANLSYMFFILKAKEYFSVNHSEKISVILPIILYIISNIVYATFSVPFGDISDKIGRRKMLIAGYFLFSLTALGFAYFSSFLIFFILFFLYGLVNAIVDANQRVYVSDLAPRELKATALGVFHAIIGIASIIEGIIVGILWQKISPFAALIYASLITAVAGTMFFIFKNQLSPEAFSKQ